MEKDIQHGILEYLKLKKIFCWKQHNAGIKKSDGGYIPSGMKGIADILGILPGGRFLAIEVKTAKGRTTPYQDEFINTINQQGGLAFVARSIDDVMAQIQ